MIHCKSCGTLNNDNSNFCSHCGSAFKADDATGDVDMTNAENELQNIEYSINGRIVEERLVGSQPKIYRLQGTAVLTDDKIIITKRSFLRGKDRGEKHIRYEDINTVDLDRKGILSPGAIQIYINGCQFSIKKKKAYKLESFFEKLNEKVMEAKNKHNISITSQKSDADELSKFAKLMKDGIISEEEFEVKKKEILGL